MSDFVFIAQIPFSEPHDTQLTERSSLEAKKASDRLKIKRKKVEKSSWDYCVECGVFYNVDPIAGRRRPTLNTRLHLMPINPEMNKIQNPRKGMGRFKYA